MPMRAMGLAPSAGPRTGTVRTRHGGPFAVGHARAGGMLLWGRFSVYDSK